MAATDLTDACQVCAPGDPPASPPVGTPLQVPPGTVTAHQCALCGAAWETLWRDGWPIDRMLAPVAPDDGARNRETLKRALRSAEWPVTREAAA